MQIEIQQRSKDLDSDFRNYLKVWALEYYTLILFLVLGSHYSYLYLKSIYFFSGSTPEVEGSGYLLNKLDLQASLLIIPLKGLRGPGLQLQKI